MRDDRFLTPKAWGNTAQIVALALSTYLLNFLLYRDPLAALFLWLPTAGIAFAIIATLKSLLRRSSPRSRWWPKMIDVQTATGKTLPDARNERRRITNR